MSTILKVAAAAGCIAGAAITIGATAQAAPVPTGVAKLGKVTANPVTTVQYRRWGGGGWRGGGWRRYGWRGYGWRYPYRYGYGWGWGWPYYYGAGLVVGTAVAAPYYYEPPVYTAPVYAPPPAATPSGAMRQCWVSTDSSRGFGYWQPC